MIDVGPPLGMDSPHVYEGLSYTITRGLGMLRASQNGIVVMGVYEDRRGPPRRMLQASLKLIRWASTS